MIWIIIGIIALTSTTGHSTFFLTPKLKQNIKEHVIDKPRREEIFTIMKSSKKEQKEFVKQRKNYLKSIKKLNLDRNAIRSQFEELNADYMKARHEIQVFSIDRELEIKQIVKQEEWENMMTDILGDIPKNKIRDKMETSSDKFFNKLINACNKNISVDLAKDKAIQSIDGYREKVNAFIPRLAELGYRSLETIRDYNTPENVYREGGKELNQIRKEITDSFLDVRFELLECTTEKEWKKIITEFNQILMKGPKVT